MNEKIKFLEDNIKSGNNIIQFKRKNRHSGKIILDIGQNKKQIIELFGDELMYASCMYYEYLLRKN